MGAPETGWYRTESGVVLEMDHPLPGGIAQRVRKGEIVRVANAAGDPWQPPSEEPKPPVDELSAELAEVKDRAEAAETRAAELEAELAEVKAERDERLTLAESSKLAARIDELTSELDKAKAAEPEASPARSARATKSTPAKAEK